jgi:DNA polymerase-3 subunit delta'
MEKLIHPDVHFSFPVNTSKGVAKEPASDHYLAAWREQLLDMPYFTEQAWYGRIGIENKQGLINRQESEQIIRKLSLKPYESDSKVLIIWLPERMNRTAANMLLKLIEEPPHQTVILLVSNEWEGILPTIRSRCQPVKFNPLTESDLYGFIKANGNALNNNVIEEIAHNARGNVLRALEILQQDGQQTQALDRFMTLMRLCYKGRAPELLQWVDEITTEGREQLKLFLHYALIMIRENFMLHVNNKELIYLSASEKEFSVKFHPFVNVRNAAAIYHEFNVAYRDIEANGYPKLVLFDLALKLSTLLKS